MARYVLKLCLLYNFGPSFFQKRQAILDIPKNSTAAGELKNVTQILNISWFFKDDNITNNFIIYFEKNITENRYIIRNFTIIITPTKDVFPDINGKLKG